ncbi:alpha-1,3-mannosyl-glycoprotein 4-beta-N-acetylglucosaminyltransferase B-like [Ylistrum balloti]|uniref:alpha-1,3-mannosyl-glycoprotein 4-beta-N-acetylglucosaminyltransferase B-like n=1 Tax=Ylistrum balloti TaxID=509963 RepID=UPI002905DA7A|nr:alpha-1,3-mannosyl-glycoprotein 4-beta-N-acetylglucosaminyltransferase B-like [Ylistrum balloti]
MRAKPKNVLILIGIVCTLPLFWLSLFTKQDGNYEQLLERRFSELREKLQSAELLNRQRENDLHMVRSQFTHLLQTLAHSNVTNRTSADFGLGLPMSSLPNISDLYSQGSLHLPSLFTYLPHLIGKSESLKPKYQLTNSRYGTSIVFGIPTIKRDNVSYLTATVKSLISGMSPKERDESLIVVFVAEPWNMEYVEEVGKLIQNEFGQHVDSGLLEIISPSPEFYPNLNNLPQTYGDTKDRVKWRTKQNLDFSFLMLYARSRGVYYVQLEDDVIAKPGYFSIMKKFAEQQHTEEWMLLEFSALGFIGKMFKSVDLPLVVEFFLMFHRDKPIDWLLDYLLSVKVCNPEKDSRHCTRMKATVRRRYKPSLFQHVGMKSSLKGKVQKLKDKDFGKQMLHRAHANPSADLTSSLKMYQKYSFQKAYIGQDIFWATEPKNGDLINIKFKTPMELDGVLFRSGNPAHIADIFYNTSVEIMPDNPDDENELIQHGIRKTLDGFFIMGWFDEDGLADCTFPSDIGKISKIRLHVHANSKNWIILSEVHIKTRESGS